MRVRRGRRSVGGSLGGSRRAGGSGSLEHVAARTFEGPEPDTDEEDPETGDDNPTGVGDAHRHHRHAEAGEKEGKSLLVFLSVFLRVFYCVSSLE